MGYKLGSNSGRAIFIKDDKYYDVNTISNGDISSNSVEALSDTCLLYTSPSPRD